MYSMRTGAKWAMRHGCRWPITTRQVVTSGPATAQNPLPAGTSHNFPQPHDPVQQVVACPKGNKVAFTMEHPAEPVTHHVAIAIHGTPGSTWDWRYLGPALTALNVPLLRFDLPGHGKSCRGLVDYPTGGNMARALWQMLQLVAEEKGWTKASSEPRTVPQPEATDVVLIGHSLGCEVTMHAVAECLASDQNHVTVAGLVLVNPAGLRPNRAMRPYRLLQLLARLLDFPQPFPFVVRRALYALFVHVYGFPKRTSIEEVEWSFRRGASRNFIRLAQDVEFIRAHRVPTAIFYSKDDPLVETAVPEELSKAIGAHHLVLFDRGGHYLNKFQANEIAAMVRRLVEEHAEGLKQEQTCHNPL